MRRRQARCLRWADAVAIAGAVDVIALDVVVVEVAAAGAVWATSCSSCALAAITGTCSRANASAESRIAAAATDP